MQDLGECPYFQRLIERGPGKDPPHIRAHCAFGCREVAACVQYEPAGGWPSQAHIERAEPAYDNSPF
jgi:hypothetical protein